MSQEHRTHSLNIGIGEDLKDVDVTVHRILRSNFQDLESGLLGDATLKLYELTQEFLDHIENALFRNEESGVLSALREVLQCVSQILKHVSMLLGFISNENDIEWKYLERSPMNMLLLINVLYTHCKNSQQMYSTCFDSLKEILQLFKTAQEIHSKLMVLLSRKIKFIATEDEDLQNLLEVIEGLHDTIDIASGMNMTTVINSWNCYTNLTTDYSEQLKFELNIERALTFVAVEVLKLLNELESLPTDKSDATKKVKLASFYVKVAKHIFRNYWDLSKSSESSVFQFFLDMYSFQAPYAVPQLISQEILEAIEQNIYTQLDEHFVQFIVESNILQKNCSSDPRKPSIGFCVVTVRTLNNERMNKPSLASQFLKKFLDCLHPGTFFLLRGLKIKSYTFYNYLLYTFVGKLLRVNQQEFVVVEDLLLTFLLKGNSTQSLFATELWRLILRNVPDSLKYDVIASILGQLRKLRLHGLQSTRLGCFLRSIYNALPSRYKEQMSDAFPMESNFLAWCMLGFESRCVGYLLRKIDSLNRGVHSLDDLLVVINGLDLLSPSNFSKHEDATRSLLKLWNVEFSDVEVLDNSLLKLYLQGLSAATVNFIRQFNNHQLSHIFDQLTHLIRHDSAHIKLCVLDVLNAIIHAVPDKILPSKRLQLSEMVHLVLCDTRSIVRQSCSELVNKILLDPSERISFEQTMFPKGRSNSVVLCERTKEEATDEDGLRNSVGGIKDELSRIFKLAQKRKVSADVFDQIRDIATMLNKRLKSVGES